MSFYIESKSGESIMFHTGEFDRSVPPCPYLTSNISDAATWETREAAQAWVDQFGGEVSEISDELLNEINIIGSTTYNAEVVGLEMDGEDVIVTLRVPKAKPFAYKKWGFTTKMNLEVYE